MGAAVKWGVLLAVAVTVLNTIWVLAGLHTSPASAMGYLACAIVMDVIAVIFALKVTAAENRYGGQFLSGLVLGVVGCVLIFLTSWLELAFVFPEAIPDQIAGFKASYESMPVAYEVKQEMMAALDGVTPLNSAFHGATGTLATSVIAGAIAAIFLRRK